MSDQKLSSFFWNEDKRHYHSLYNLDLHHYQLEKALIEYHYLVLLSDRILLYLSLPFILLCSSRDILTNSLDIPISLK